MGVDRRNFIKIAGLSTVALVSKPVVDALADIDLPEDSPLEAKRWAMVIDLKKCEANEGCTACIDACHLEHNVPDFKDAKDEIKWIWTEHFEHAFHELDQEYINKELKHLPALVLCNHCDNPPCVRACPTGATFKRDDGIVMMDWHRCIGCRYCLAACPYGSRSFNWRDPKPAIKEEKPNYPTRMRGIVEKCTFCDERLAKGQMPACVDACPVGALVFDDLENPDSIVRKLLAENFTIRRKPGLGTKPEIYYIV
ncbi:MAG: 4Fe-4S dicluster domain-containing protein [Candidatus Hatepunaea meridiana]|nr:4Fe-4S dicluster domain-containing protein [Candidatus Hatepunaea meridiana]